ncbi:MAG: leucine-rich repeat protein [Lachnospiraceae bacterium]|nr:leucine-rich repeat protein [Lachnospiraceae bacterium]
MAKKTPARKPRRRLKRSVRRSLSAVLMITAIAVAAIPVPENYADNGTASSRAATVIDKHDMSKFVYDADSADDVDSQLAINLSAYKDKSVEDIMNGKGNGANPPKAYPSYAITDIGGGDISLSWQFLFYEVKNPIDNVDSGVICKYNSRFYSEKVELGLRPITKYYTVESEAFENYYAGTANTGMDNKATDEVVLDYATYVSDDRNSANVKSFYNKYLKTEYDSKVKEFQDYEKALADYNKAEDKTNLTKPTIPSALIRIPSEVLTGEQRLQYYCEHNTAIRNSSSDISGYTLRSAVDNRPEPEGKGGTVYLVSVPEGNTPTDPYTKDDAGFLVEERSQRLMCAIGDGAFKAVNNVVNMTIPDQIGFIGDEAFADASLLETITIGNTAHIGNRAFKGCVKLATVDIRQGTQTIGKECFSGTAIQQIALPVSVMEIGYGAFSNCRNLSTVDLNSIGRECKIDDYAFYNCSALSDIKMKDATIVSIGDGAFAVEAGSQPMGIVLPQGMTESKSIGNYLFAGRSALEYVVFPQNYGRTSSKAATIPREVFHGCANLKYVEFPCDAQRDPQACGFVSYDKTDLDSDGEIIRSGLFQDVINPEFYVKGPKLNNESQPAYPRTSTWDATTTVSDTVPYLYIENGVEYYEVSDGTYLLCINDKGILTSCTFKPGLPASKKKNVHLVIPSVVGNTKVVGIAEGCFSDSELNENVISLKIEDNSLTSIAKGVFQGGGGDNGKDWQMLEQVYIGNSVTSIGENAFKDCISLVDVTFSSPLGGYEAFTIGTDAFKTESGKLTFHGDIVKGYAPFDWAMNPNNIIDTESRIRVCYKSLSPSYLTVMYNPITDMVTLLDYPKYSEVSKILNEAHADEITKSGAKSYEEMKTAEWYGRYAGTDYDSYRVEFAQAWQAAADKETVYASEDYGPWVNESFCSEWEDWVDGNPHVTPGPIQPDISGNSTSNAVNKLTDWLFEPMTVYAADTSDPDNPPISSVDPKPYYTMRPYNVVEIVDANDPYRAPTGEEMALVDATKNIVIPEGVESIDVYGYIRNYTVDGNPTESSERNTGNYNTYLRNNSWSTEVRKMYESTEGDEDDNTKVVPGLFSGYYKDYEGTSANELYTRGNDLIRSVTMKSVKYLPDYAFDSCESLLYVMIGPDCADIGKAPFRGCYSMTNVEDNDYYTTVNGIIYSKNTDGSLVIEECLAARGSGKVGPAVVNTSTDANLEQVSAIKPGAFEDCDYITNIEFGSESKAGLAVIPEDCFRNCDKLQTVVLPITTNDIGSGAFSGANNLGNLTIYGKEVKISGTAFDDEKTMMTTVRAYEDSAVVRYVKEYGDVYHLQIDDQHPLGELWQVAFYDANYVLIPDLKDKSGNDLDNPQYVEDGSRPIEPADPVLEGWTFEQWAGMNNVKLGDTIHADTSFYAQGFTENGMVNGKYPVAFYDGVDGKQIGPTQYILPGGEAIAPAHPVHAGYEQNGYSDSYTNISSAKNIVLLYKVAAGTSGGSTNTSGGSTNTSGNGTNTSGNGTNTSGNTTSSSTSSSSTSTTSSTTSSSTASTSTTSTTANAGLYTVTVLGGSGSGSYAAGTTVQITANTPAAGSVFSRWVTESQGVSLANVSQTPTTFVMPSNNVTITAEYTAGTAPASTATSNNGGGGSTDNGNTRVDITKPGISNKDLATANVNGSTDNFIVKITETDEATRAVADALTNKYGSLDNILYYAMDISLWDSTGTYQLTGDQISGLSVDITIPIPDALVAYGGNNMAGAVINGNQLENLNENFTTINGVPCIRFTATHFSPYTVYVDTGNLTEGMLDATPKTGDPIHPKWFLSVGLACLSIILFIKKDKAAKVKTA